MLRNKQQRLKFNFSTQISVIELNWEVKIMNMKRGRKWILVRVQCGNRMDAKRRKGSWPCEMCERKEKAGEWEVKEGERGERDQ